MLLSTSFPNRAITHELRHLIAEVQERSERWSSREVVRGLALLYAALDELEAAQGFAEQERGEIAATD